MNSEDLEEEAPEFVPTSDQDLVVAVVGDIDGPAKCLAQCLSSGTANRFVWTSKVVRLGGKVHHVSVVFHTSAELATVFKCNPAVIVYNLSALDRLTFATLSKRLKFFAKHGSKCKLLLCMTELESVIAWRRLDKQAMTKTATSLGIVAHPDLCNVGPILWEELLPVLKEHKNVSMFRCVSTKNRQTGSLLLKDIIYLTESQKRYWKHEMPHALKDNEKLAERFTTISKHRGSPQFYEELDLFIHDVIVHEWAKPAELCLLWTEERLDPKSFCILMSHWQQNLNWNTQLHPTHIYFYGSAIFDSAADWANEQISSIDGTAPLATSLISSYVSLETIPDSLLSLSKLTCLNLSHNYLTEIPSSLFTKLTSLTNVDLSWNKLTSIPENINHLTTLMEFNLEHNAIVSLPDSIGDCMKMRLLCGYNQLNTLPHSLRHHLSANKLNYLPNPLENLRKYNTQAELCEYLDELALAGTTRWNKIRLMLVGPENVGKTTLAHRFQGKTHDGISTGQAVFLPTHQFFMTGRAMYLVMFDLQHPHTHRIEYWLRQIMKTVKQPPNPPVILIGTHADRITPKSYVPLLCKELYGQFKCFGGVVDCIPLCTTQGDLFDLENCIIKTAVAKQMTLREKIPGSWVKLERLICEKKKKKPTVRWTKFVKWATQVQIFEPAKIKQAAHFLHGVGSLIYYDSKYSNIGDLVILDPEYLSSLMATLITFKTTMIINGYISSSILPLIWSSYDPIDYPALINLMCLYLIMHPVVTPTGEGYLIPCTLPDTVPDDAESIWPQIIPPGYQEQERQLQFPCLPIGLFGRILVRILHWDTIQRKAFWNNNIRLSITPQKDPRIQSAYIEFDCSSGNSTILFLRVRAPQDSKPDLLCDVIECVETTIDCFYNHCIQVSANIPPGKQPIARHRFLRNEIISAVTARTTLICKVGNVPVRLDVLAPDILLSKQVIVNREDLEDLSKIAAGGFGVVYKAKLKGEIVAVKELSLHGDLSTFTSFKAEVQIMSMLDNPFVVKLLGVCVSPPMMVMEYVPHGTLFDLLHLQRTPGSPSPQNSSLDSDSILDSFPPNEEQYDFPMKWRFRMQIALDIAKGLAYLHSLHPPIVHRDLRSPNIFIQSLDSTADCRVKIADFGLSLQVAGKVTGNLATWQWLAPEVLEAREEYDESSDLFSAGVIFYEIATRQYPYDEYATLPQYSLKRGSDYEWREQNIKSAIAREGIRPTLPPWILRPFGELIQQCWKGHPQQRPSAQVIMTEINDILDSRVPETQNPKTPDVPPPTSLWEVLIEDKYPIWSLLEYNNLVWVGCADGSVRRVSRKTGMFIGVSIPLLQSARIYSLLALNDELWASTEFGKIFVLDPNAMCQTTEISAHGSKHIITCLICVRDPRKNSEVNSSYIWSASQSESCIVVVDSKTKEVVNRSSFEPSLKIGSMAQCNEYVWLGCLNRVIIMDCSSMLICSTLRDSVWFSVKASLFVYNSENMVCCATLLDHTDDISCICQCNEFIWSADCKGSIFGWSPQSFELCHRLTLPDYMLCTMGPVVGCLWYSFVHPAVGLGCFNFEKKTVEDTEAEVNIQTPSKDALGIGLNPVSPAESPPDPAPPAQPESTQLQILQLQSTLSKLQDPPGQSRQFLHPPILSPSSLSPSPSPKSPLSSPSLSPRSSDTDTDRSGSPKTWVKPSRKSRALACSVPIQSSAERIRGLDENAKKTLSGAANDHSVSITPTDVTPSQNLAETSPVLKGNDELLVVKPEPSVITKQPERNDGLPEMMAILESWINPSENSAVPSITITITTPEPASQGSLDAIQVTSPDASPTVGAKSPVLPHSAATSSVDTEASRFQRYSPKSLARKLSFLRTESPTIPSSSAPIPLSEVRKSSSHLLMRTTTPTTLPTSFTSLSSPMPSPATLRKKTPPLPSPVTIRKAPTPDLVMRTETPPPKAQQHKFKAKRLSQLTACTFCTGTIWGEYLSSSSMTNLCNDSPARLQL
ncbi:leucinerich repeat kinase [Pelomyxa schiedti]|nr:leucinerich repeat kinase [Pelomyxa schiedti]